MRGESPYSNGLMYMISGISTLPSSSSDTWVILSYMGSRKDYWLRYPFRVVISWSELVISSSNVSMDAHPSSPRVCFRIFVFKISPFLHCFAVKFEVLDWEGDFSLQTSSSSMLNWKRSTDWHDTQCPSTIEQPRLSIRMISMRWGREIHYIHWKDSSIHCRCTISTSNVPERTLVYRTLDPSMRMPFPVYRRTNHGMNREMSSNTELRIVVICRCDTQQWREHSGRSTEEGLSMLMLPRFAIPESVLTLKRSKNIVHLQ